MNFMRTPIGRLRSIAMIEGISFLLLLGIAMPLKYLADFPTPVKVVGWIHGLFFVLYLLALADVSRKRQWSRAQIVWALVASVVPFGTFVLDARLRQEEKAS
jgi:integral membrane protein